MKKKTIRSKEVTHNRIVEAASRAIRRSGYSGTGVADIMKSVGLTHGGFYAHFESRDAMLAEAADRAGAETIALATDLAASAPRGQALERLAQAYLSKAHLEDIENGCPIAALGSEMPRQAPEVRHAATCHIKEILNIITQQFPDREGTDATGEALLTMSTMVGALILARAVDDPAISETLRQVVIEKLSILTP
ncbi:TetR family transcriptional regulator [Pectobacterium araliae]|uniref:TetR/AcrR family transcriptional regulator n=1 Tax=Pectobacterium araliae TaxID=3073862 RepID=A0AAN0MM28_9GAMM|nr:TetR/AcrR family transcriptional regulator [Pectobacterium sp. MAFF 302110]GKW20242.1 TetR family transcriptional regulator [Pectobacterium carotovorum subsp. carotovorum]